MYDHPRFLPAGDRALVVEFGNEISAPCNQTVRAFARAVRELSFPGIRQVVPAYRSALVEYDPLALDYPALLRLLELAAEQARQPARPLGRLVAVPVLYGGEHALDLDDVLCHSRLTRAELVQRHSAVDYRCYCVGFSAGFAYLGGLDPRLAVPRLSTPRARVARGSVGIGGQQTGVYPSDSPGGWRLIGHTPVRHFDPLREPPVLVRPGDTVRFYPVGREEYDAIAARVAAGTYTPEFSSLPEGGEG